MDALPPHAPAGQRPGSLLRRFQLSEVLALIESEYALEGDIADKWISRARPIGSADHETLAWIDPARADKQQLLEATQACAVVGDAELRLPEGKDTVLIKVAEPKLTFIKVLNQLFEDKPPPGIHPSAVIHPVARIADDVHIGPLCCIGNVEIGSGCVIHSGVHLYDGVRLGRNVTVQAGCVIGVRAFSLAKDEQGDWHHMPHLGGVVIEDKVEIQALCIVDRGTLGDTVIGAGALINSGCYIAHNVQVGRRTFIAGHTVIAGSVTIGADCWIGPKTVVRDRISIGSGCFIGMGSVVVASLDENARVMGNPARDIDAAKALLLKLKQL
jgi:UDP-3-O-[3-hydroxymyristoyl] glucosamine N-acyltransferase